MQVFMDQRGTAFHDDQQYLEQCGLLAEPAVLVADNVLKPGAPYHVWRISTMPPLPDRHHRPARVRIRAGRGLEGGRPWNRDIVYMWENT